MDSNIFDSLVKLLPPERKEEILSAMQKNVIIEGFRKGKAPRSKILSSVQTNIRLQQAFLISICTAYFPNKNYKEIDPDEPGQDPETLPGRLAAGFLKRPGDVQGIWESSQSEIESYQALFLSEESQQEDPGTEEGSAEESSEPESEAAGSMNTGSSIPAHEPQDEIPSEDDEHEEEYAPNDEEEDAVPAEADIYASENDYMGYIQIKHTQGGGIYYNFYPIARYDPERRAFVTLSYDEKITKFPQYGNINICNSGGRLQDLSRYFENGRIYIIQIDPYFEEENYNSSGALNLTQKKIDLKELLEYKFLHDPEEPPFNCYQVFDVPNFAERIANERQITLALPDPSVKPCQSVLFRDADGRLIGPFSVKEEMRRGEDTYSYYVYPEARKNHYMYTVYDNSNAANAPFIIQYEGLNSGADRQTEIICINGLKTRQEDFASNDLLLRELQTLYEQEDSSRDGKPDFFQSDLLGAGVAENIVQARIARMEKFIQQNSNQKHMLEYFTEFFARSLREKLLSNDPMFDEIIQRLTENPKFMNGLSGTRILTEAMNQKQEEYEQFCAEIDEKKAEKQKELDSVKQQLADKQSELTTFLAEAHRNEQKKYENLHKQMLETEAKLAELTEKYDLAKEIEQLREQCSAGRDQLQQTQHEKSELEKQIAILTRHFEKTADEALSKVAELKINERLSKVLSAEPAARSGQQEKDERSIRIIRAQAELCESHEEDAAALPGRLTDFFKNFRINYSINDILNLYICFTQGFLTVLSGAPGTGKTTACKILAHSLGLDNPVLGEERFIPVQVERGWSSKRDLIGYYNPLTRSFDKSQQGVYRALELSDLECRLDIQEKIPPMAILLDEANLSQMEYYWASFMNAGDRSFSLSQIDLGNGNVFRIAPSLRFLATINNDHTTESLSPRLIDRAWVVTLPTGAAGNQVKDVDFSSYEPVISLDLLSRVFGRPADPEAKLDLYCDGILKEIYRICSEKNISISERTKGAVRDYCLAGSRVFREDPRTPDMTHGVIAADFAVAQKVLPKIQGHGPSFKQNVLNDFKQYFDENNLVRSSRILDAIIRSGDANMNYYRFFG